MSEVELDSIVYAKFIVPIVPARKIYEDSCIAVKKGSIVDICSLEDAKKRYPSSLERLTILSDQHVILPGLINMHTHAAMTLLRGFGDNLKLYDWLQKVIWPAEGALVSENFVKVGGELAALEMLKCGITFFNDMYFYPEPLAEVIDRVGMRAQLAATIYKFPAKYASGEDECIAKAKAFLSGPYKSHSRISLCVGVHAPYSVTDRGLDLVKELRVSREDGQWPLHIHVHETASEVQDSLNEFGVRPIARLHAHQQLDDRVIAVHTVHLSEEDILLLKTNGVHCVHCPESNAKLGSGLCPVVELLKNGINVSLGTDGAGSNDDLDLLGEVRTAILVSKIQQNSAIGISAFEALEMCTIRAAKALHMESRIGSLEVGKAADFIAVRLENIPVYNIFNTLAYCGNHRVTDVWVEGNRLIYNEQPTTIDVEKLKKCVEVLKAEVLDAVKCK